MDIGISPGTDNTERTDTATHSQQSRQPMAGGFAF
jgi:hypothetical protein